MGYNYQYNAGEEVAKKIGGVKMRTLVIVLSIISAVIIAIAIFIGLVRFTLYSNGLRFLLVLLALIWSIPLVVYIARHFSNSRRAKGFKSTIRSVPKQSLVPAILAIVLVVFYSVISIASTPLFLASSYYELIDVVEYEEADFISDIVNYDEMLVPIVDKDLAINLGDKILGEQNLGSQFEVLNYSLSYYDGDIYWIGVIEYTGFFKWTDNYKTGSPGYVKVSATKSPYEYSIVDYPITYVSSAYFAQDRDRTVYLGGNMTKMTSGRVSAELDDAGNLMFVQSVNKKNFLWTGGEDTRGSIIFDPTTGESTYYDVLDEPSWVDRVHSTETVVDQLDYWGAYKYGFWNTVFAKKEVLSTTDGYAYIVNQDDNGDTNIYLYTGMTSVGSDESIVGVVLVNLKTKESRMYYTAGATESAAMSSAEGVVQDLGYDAAWPILLNYDGVPTYLVMLKDSAGLVKSYAYVNLKDYSIVGKGETLAEAQVAYNTKIAGTAEQEEEEGVEVTLTIKDAQQVMQDGNTYYLIKFEGDEYTDIYKMLYSVNEEILFMDTLAGRQVTVTISGSDIKSLDFI